MKQYLIVNIGKLSLVGITTDKKVKFISEKAKEESSNLDVLSAEEYVAELDDNEVEW